MAWLVFLMCCLCSENLDARRPVFGDIDGDGFVNVADVLQMIAAFAMNAIDANI